MSTTFRSAFALLTLLVLLAPGGAIAWRGFGSWFRSPEDRPAFDAVEPTDWSDKMIAWWGLDEATGTTRAASGGTCADAGTDCDLTNNSTGSGVTRDTSIFVEGDAAALFENDDAEYLSCADGTCDELDLTTSSTWGCWARHTADDATTNIIFNASGGYGYSLSRLGGANDSLRCVAGGGSSVLDDTSVGTFNSSTWVHGVCRFDDEADELEAFTNVSGSGSPTTLTSIGAAVSTYVFSATGNGVDGQLDECFVMSTALRDAEICRICSCGIDGSYCMCDNDDPTSYRACNADADCRYQSNTTAICDATNGTCSGRNNSTDPGCSGCTLPDCNAGLLEEPADWSGSMIAWWDLDEASGSRSQSGGTCGADCDLTDNNTVGQDTTDKTEGDASADLVRANNEYLYCTNANCEELALVTSLTWGCWTKEDLDDLATSFMGKRLTSPARGWDSYRSNTTDELFCRFWDTTNTQRTVQTVNDGFPTTTWKHLVCQFDNPNDTLEVFEDGTTNNSTGNITQSPSAETANFYLGFNTGSGGKHDGHLDECFVTDIVLSDAEICRICSCEIDGGLCACDPDTPANYKSCTDDADCRFGSHNLATCDTASGTCIGRNAGSDPGCGSCALPDCNAAAPS